MSRLPLILLAGLGVVVAGCGWVWTWQLTQQRAALAFLAAHWFLFSLAVGSLALLLIVNAAHALWAVPLRRVLERAWVAWPLSALSALGLVWLAGDLFPWAGAGQPHEHGLQRQIAHHAAWFDGWLPLLRGVLILLLGLVPALLLRHWSCRQDEDSSMCWHERMRKFSAAALPVLALAATVACLDWLFALSPHYHSTVFGVLVFASGAQAALAVWIFAAWVGERGSHLRLGAGQWYALGTLFFAFTCFWAYCQLSQALITYMGDMPNQVPWLLARRDGWWGWASLLLVLGRFGLPFLLLLTRVSRQRPALLTAVAAPVMGLHALETLWWVVPMGHGSHADAAWSDLAALLAAAAALLFALALAHRRGDWAPRGDPRYAQALEHHPG